MSTLERFQLTIPADQYDQVILFLTENAPQGWEEDVPYGSPTAFFKMHIEDHPLADELFEKMQKLFPDGTLTRDKIKKEDWTSAWMDFFTPVHAGGIFEVLPPWLEDEQDAESQTIIIDPKMAFGTGHHATTALCLEVIGKLSTQGVVTPEQRFLDLGTGSGILAIGLAKLGLSGIGLDIDPQAVSCAEENVNKNGVADKVSVGAGSIDCLQADQKFGLIVANILSKPLIFLAPKIVEHLAPGATLILSGVLEEQAPDVIAAYTVLGLAKPTVTVQGEWTAIHWESV